MDPIDVGLGLQNTHILITGGAGLIGKATVVAFLSAGACVTAADIDQQKLDNLEADFNSTRHKYPPSSALCCVQVDVTSEKSIDNAFSRVQARFGVVRGCVTLAALDLSVLTRHKSVIDMSLDQFQRTLQVNVSGTFLTAKAFLKHLSGYDHRELNNKSLVLVGSESGHFGSFSNPDYAASKSAVQFGLLRSLKADVPRIAPGCRVNAIAPGPVDTDRFKQECSADVEQYWIDAQVTTALGEPVPVEIVAKQIVILASDNLSSHVHGHILNVDSGKQGNLMWRQKEKPERALRS